MANSVVYVVKVSGKAFLQLRWFDGSRWRQKSSGSRRQRDAQRAADQWAEQLDAGVHQQGLEWYDFVQRNEDERLSRLSPKSRTDWRTASKMYGELMAPENVRDLTANELSKFAAKLRNLPDGPKSQSVVDRYLGELRRALVWAEQLRLIDRAPFVPKPTGKRGNEMLGRPITTEEYERMLGKCGDVVGDQHAEAMQDTLTKYWLSGFRRVEALDIWWDRPDRHRIDNIERSRPKLMIRGDFEKGRRDRIYPLTPDFVAHLRETNRWWRFGPVWNPTSSKGPTRSPSTIGKLVSQIGEAAGVIVDVDPATGETKYASLHDMRRSFGTRWAPLVKPVVLQQLMRHSSIQTTMKYYVDLNTNVTADEVWKAFGTRLCDPLCDPQELDALSEQ